MLKKQKLTVTPLGVLLLAWLLFILYHAVVNGYCKHLETYNDEWIYYGIAESLATGRGFPAIYGTPYNTTRYLYSLLIAPALLVGGRIVQFHLLAMINAILIGSGAIPVYLLAKDILSDRWLPLAAGCLYLIQPDMEFTATFMTENIWLPVALWVFYFVYRLINDKGKPLRIQGLHAALLAGFSILFLYIKSSGFVVIISYLIVLFIVGLFRLIKGISANHKNSGLIAAVVLFVIGAAAFIVWLFLFSPLGGQVLPRFSVSYASFEADPVRYLRCYFYMLATDLMAIGFFPVLLPLTVWGKVGKKAKKLFGFAALVMLLANISIAHTSIATTDSDNLPEFRLHQRYVMYLWILFLIVFLDLLRREWTLSIWSAVLTAAVIIAFCLLSRGVAIGSAVDTSWLLWARDWIHHRWRWTAAVIALACTGLVLLKKNRKWFAVYFFAIMLIVAAADHIAMHDLIKNAYEFSYTDVREVEEYILDHAEDNFLVVTVPHDIHPGGLHYKAKVADTFLMHNNTYFASGTKIAGIQSDEGTDLSKRTSKDLGIAITGDYELDHFDYIVLSTDMMIDDENAQKVLDQELFCIYKLVDPYVIPHMIYLNHTWGTPGKTRYYPPNGFGCMYQKNGEMTFISEDKPDYVLCGPYVTIPAGKYTVTVNYSYEGDHEGVIGQLDLAGTEIDSSVCCTSVYAEKETVELSFETGKECEVFEVRLLAQVPGIKINFIDVDEQRMDVIEYDTWQLHRYVKADNRSVREEYYTSDGERTQGIYGFYAVEYDYDNSGNISELRYYDTENLPLTFGSGHSVIKRQYDENRWIIRESYYDDGGSPIVRTEGYHAVEYDHNENGDIVEYRYFGEDGKPALLGSGFAMSRKEYNEQRQVIREEFYDQEYQPVLRTEGYYAVEYGYDSNGNINEYHYLDLKNCPVTISSGYATLRYQFNEARQVVREEYYGTEDEPVNRGEYHAVEYDRDANGDVVEYRYFGEDGKPVLLGSGFAMSRKEYNGQRQVIREEFYDQEYQPVMRAEGYYAVEYGYDAAGNLNEYRYYDTEEKPVVMNKGYAKVCYVFNDAKQVIREDYYGAEDEPVSINGYHAIEYDRDANGDVVEYRYFGEDGKPILLGSGFAMSRKEYNAQRQVIREEFYDHEYQPVLRTEGYYAVEYGYDPNGNIKEYHYLDLKNRPVMISSGYATLRYQFNEARQVIREEYYGTEDEPVNRGEYHAVEYDRDANGDVVEYRYFGEDGEPVLLGSGFAMSRKAYNENRQVIREEFYDLDYQPVLRAEGYYAVEYGYDSNGNINEYRYYDTEEKPVVMNKGYAKVCYVFNDAKQVIREDYYGAEDEPVSINGYHAIEYDRDQEGNITVTRYYDTENRLVSTDVAE